ncbi:unnamed protein product [Onchocerca flexuosa]|uniref:Skp1_POZ domain-containing protein n=1 Tax=Onchocerca flexuosa TaxID=387005 RepID=A0A183HX14_9BILA|nr:unnamed protein product [Onchocerca flexuosa]
MSEQKPAQQKISLISSDNETFEVDRNVIRLSTTINTMLQGKFIMSDNKRFVRQ